MSAFWLKTLACLFMLTDHVGAVFHTLTPDWLRWIGRIAFPIYVFFIAEGCARTRNIHRYLLRLGVFALVSEIPFDMALAFFARTVPAAGRPVAPLSALDFLSFTNVFYTLFIGVLAVSVYGGVAAGRRPALALLPLLILTPLLLNPSRAATTGLVALYAAVVYVLSRCLPAREGQEKEGGPIVRLIALAAAAPTIGLATLLDTDYGAFGVIFILALHLAGSRPRKLACLFIFICLEYASPAILTQPFSAAGGLLGTALLAVPLIAMYNDRRGPKVKWAFYAFYPAHLAILAALAVIIFRNG
ncbi:MAG: conjugal transfer protein TraX [Gracilibacteraceae bacterium]|jgi:hypothetical protein|nr:conjugal transfer protein TraX [Gracilibacteraceae bacterium]